MRAFGASDAACYKWPDDTVEHKALRAAYCAGAAEYGGSAEILERQLAEARAIIEHTAYGTLPDKGRCREWLEATKG